MKTTKSKTYYIQTFGCQMNHSDSERFARILNSAGYVEGDDWKKSDLLVFNTCSVKQKAEDRVIGLGPQIEELKSRNSDFKVVLTGCMARRQWRKTDRGSSQTQMSAESRENDLISTMPWLDLVIETKDFAKLPQKLGASLEFKEEPQSYLSYKPKYNNSFQAFVPISTGCDHFCTFCIVPFARGSEICRPAREIITEVYDLIRNGYKDVMLLGQTVNRWVNPDYDEEIKEGMIANTKIPILNTKPLNGIELKKWREFFSNNFKNKKFDLGKDLYMPRDFLQLLQIIDQIPGRWWTTWVSSHPNYMTDELIEFLGASVEKGFNSNWTEGHQRSFIHFAVQSGNNNILKRMNRRYTREEFIDRVKKLRTEIPQLALATDIIVGFPKETQEQFEDTRKLMEEMEFSMAFISEYSNRKGTAAGLLKDDVEHSAKEERKNILNDEVLEKTSRKFNKRLLGTRQLVLVDRIRKSRYYGRTSHNRDIRLITNEKDLEGKFVIVEITSFTDWAVEGEVIEIL